MIAVLTLLARLAGFGRTLVFTNTVGADSTGDIYLAANTVPNIVFEVVAGGALASLVVPMLAGGIAVGDREQVRRTASALLGWTLLVLTPLAVLVALFAEPIARLLLGGGGRAPRSTLAARFLLVFAPQVVLYGIGIVLAGVLQAHRRFAGPAIAPAAVQRRRGRRLPALRRPSAAARTSTDLTTPAELVLGVGTTLGVVALSLSLLVPLRGLRLGLRPALRFPVGAAPRVRRLALAGVLTLAGQQLVAAVAIRLANDGTPDGTQVVYAAGLTLFLRARGRRWPCRWPPRPTRACRAGRRWATRPATAGALAPVAVLTVATAAVAAGAAGGRVRARWPGCSSRSGSPEVVAALRDTIIAFAPGLVGLRAGRPAHPGAVRPRAVEGADGRASSAAGCSPSSPTSSSPRRCRPRTAASRSAPGTASA